MVTLFPTLFMLAMICWAMIVAEQSYIAKGQYLLATINIANMVIAVWMIIEAVLVMRRKT